MQQQERERERKEGWLGGEAESRSLAWQGDRCAGTPKNQFAHESTSYIHYTVQSLLSSSPPPPRFSSLGSAEQPQQAKLAVIGTWGKKKKACCHETKPVGSIKTPECTSTSYIRL